MVCSARTTLVMRGAVGLSHIRARDELRNAETFWNFVVWGYQGCLATDRPRLTAGQSYMLMSRWLDGRNLLHMHTSSIFLVFFCCFFCCFSLELDSGDRIPEPWQRQMPTNKAFLVLWIMFVCACIDQILSGGVAAVQFKRLLCHFSCEPHSDWRPKGWSKIGVLTPAQNRSIGALNPPFKRADSGSVKLQRWSKIRLWAHQVCKSFPV